MTDKDKVLIVLTTCPAGNAAAIAHALVTEGLAACVNRVPGVTSTYIWKGQVQSDSEELLVIKTTEPTVADLEARLTALHPYELPELVAIPVCEPMCAGSEKYLDWVRHNVKYESKRT